MHESDAYNILTPRLLTQKNKNYLYYKLITCFLENISRALKPRAGNPRLISKTFMFLKACFFCKFKSVSVNKLTNVERQTGGFLARALP